MVPGAEGATEMRPWLAGPPPTHAAALGGPERSCCESGPEAPDGGSDGRDCVLPNASMKRTSTRTRVLLREDAGAVHEALVVLRRLDHAAGLEREVTEDHEAVRVRGVELDRLLRGRLGLLRIDELRVVDLRELRPEACTRQIALGGLELALDKADDAEPIAARGVRLAERRARGRIARVRVEGELVALDRAVLVAARLEETGRAHPLLRLRFRRRRLRCERLDRAERRVRVAAHLAELRDRLERTGVRRLDREDLLVGLGRAIGRADLLRQRARAGEQEIDPARRIAGDRRMLLVERADRLPLLEGAVVIYAQVPRGNRTARRRIADHVLIPNHQDLVGKSCQFRFQSLNSFHDDRS